MIVSRMRRRILACALAAVLPGISPASAQVAAIPAQSVKVYPTTPRVKEAGGRWRIGYFESGNYSEYPRTLKVIVSGLQTLGWLELPTMPDGLNGRQMWDFLAENARSDYVEFVADAWWQPGDFDASLRPATREAITRRLSERDDLDLMIAMGTGAGRDMAVLGAPVATVVASTSDAVGAQIVASAEDSGLDNLHARVQPQRYERQVELFHAIVPFTTLGLVFEDSPEGRTYSAVDAVERVARDLGFVVKSCFAPSRGIEQQEATDNVLKCYRELAPSIDAVYVTVHRGITPTTISEVAGILREAKVPSFAMLRSEEVKAGLLLSLAQGDYSYVGLFHAETIARIFNGAKPRELSQIWIDPARISLNLETARAIGFNPPVDVLIAADDVYKAN